MTTIEIANRLVELCRIPDFETAQKELYGKDVISIEPEAGHGFEKETKGQEAVLEKIRKFESMIQELHSTTVSEPIIATNSFAVSMNMDVTMKEGGRMNMTELCLYKIKDGKIISEEFFM